MAKARAILYEMIGERDPVKVQRALRDALPFLDDVIWAANQIEQICAIAAARGQYSKGEQ